MYSKTILLPFAMLLGILLFSNCKKDNNPDNVSDAEYYFYGKLDGQDKLFEVEATGDVQLVNSIDGSTGPDLCTFSYGCSIGTFDPVEAPFFEVYFPDLFDGLCVNIDDDFSGLYHTGNYAFGDQTGQVLIRYWDGTELWTSDPVGQQNAQFEVTASERQETIFGIFQKVSGKANCLVFNSNGDSQKLEDVQFVLSFSKD